MGTQIGNKSLKNVEQFKYLGTILTDQNSINGEIKSRLKSGNTCCSLVQNVKVKICRIIISLVLCGCEIWLLTLREERGLTVFEKTA
jgi:hypothetical protein